MVSSPIVVTVAGGKGGVGKSMVSANLAASIAQSGANTVLVDADLGAPNQHTFFGCEKVPVTLGDFLEGRVKTLAETFVPTGLARLSLVAGQTGVVGAANPAHARKLKLARAIAALDAEVVVVDLGAGMSHNVVDLFLLGHLRFMVVAPQLTSVQNAYGFAKTALLRAFAAEAAGPREADALKLAFERRALGRIDDGIHALEADEARLAAACRGIAVGFGLELIGNMVDGARGAGVLHALSKMMRDYLHLRAPISALVPRAEELHRSVDRRQVLSIVERDAPVLRSLRGLAERITGIDRDGVLGKRRAASAWPERMSLPPPDLRMFEPSSANSMRAATLVSGRASVLPMPKGRASMRAGVAASLAPRRG